MNIFYSLLSFLTPLLTWLLKRAGAREEQIQNFIAAIREVQKNRDTATQPSIEEKQIEENLRKELKTNASNRPPDT